MTEHTYTFHVYETGVSLEGLRFQCNLGEYDLDAPTGHGDTPAAAIIDWLELHEDIIND